MWRCLCIILRMSTSEKKIAVIGGGLSGLAAAYTLSQKGFSVSVFEAESTCGGRVQSLPVHDRQVDFGGFIISTKFGFGTPA